MLRAGQRRRSRVVVQGVAAGVPVGPVELVGPVEPVGPVGPEEPVRGLSPVEPPWLVGPGCARIAVGGNSEMTPIAAATAAPAAKRACARGRKLCSHAGTRADYRIRSCVVRSGDAARSDHARTRGSRVTRLDTRLRRNHMCGCWSQLGPMTSAMTARAKPSACAGSSSGPVTIVTSCCGLNTYFRVVVVLLEAPTRPVRSTSQTTDAPAAWRTGRQTQTADSPALSGLLLGLHGALSS